MSRPYLSALAFAAFLGSAPALAQEEPSIDTVLATVGGSEITLGHAIALRATLPADYDQVPANRLFDGIVEQLVRQTLVAQDTDDALSKAAQLRLENERRAIVFQDRLSKLAADAVTDEALRQAYEALDQGEAQTEYRAAHILVETQQEADRLAAQIADGSNFAALAQEHSIGPSGASGGNLDWFGEGVMVAEFFDAVAALDEGEVSDPVQTQFGWHLIKLNETRTSAVRDFDAVRDELAQDVMEDTVDAYLATLRDEISVDVMSAETVQPEMINRVDLLEN